MLGNTTTTTAEDNTLTVVLSVLGVVYGVTAISAIVFIIVPRMMASSASAAGQAARPAAGLPTAVQAARPKQPAIRWSHSYDAVRSRPGAYVPGEEIELQRVTRVPAAPNRGFTVPDQVSLLNFV